VDAFYKNFEIDHKHLQSYTNGKLLALKLKSMGERNSRDNLKNLKIFVRPELSSHGMQENCGFLRPAEQAKEGFFLQFFKSTLKLVGKYIGSGELYRGVSPNNVNDGVNPSSGTVRTKLLSLLSPQAKMACGVYLAMADCKGQQNELSQIMHLILLARQSICYEILRLSSMVLKLSQATPFFGSHPSSRDDHYLGRAFLSVALHVQDCVLTCRAIVAHFFASCNGEQNTSDANPFFLRSKCIAEHPDSLLGLATTAIFTALTLSAWVSGDSLLLDRVLSSTPLQHASKDVHSIRKAWQRRMESRNYTHSDSCKEDTLSKTLYTQNENIVAGMKYVMDVSPEGANYILRGLDPGHFLVRNCFVEGEKGNGTLMLSYAQQVDDLSNTVRHLRIRQLASGSFIFTEPLMLEGKKIEASSLHLLLLKCPTKLVFEAETRTVNRLDPECKLDRVSSSVRENSHEKGVNSALVMKVTERINDDLSGKAHVKGVV
jgi:hypothetical protein